MATGFAPIEVPGYRFLEQTLAGCWEASRRVPRARSTPRRAPRGGLGAPQARTSKSANGPKAPMPKAPIQQPKSANRFLFSL